MTRDMQYADASMEAMYRIFTVPEAPNSKLGRIEQQISENLVGFLQQHVVAVEKELPELEKDIDRATVETVLKLVLKSGYVINKSTDDAI